MSHITVVEYCPRFPEVAAWSLPDHETAEDCADNLGNDCQPSACTRVHLEPFPWAPECSADPKGVPFAVVDYATDDPRIPTVAVLLDTSAFGAGELARILQGSPAPNCSTTLVLGPFPWLHVS